jgi:hypothetical protein
MRLVIKNSITLCLRTLVFSIVLRHSNYNNNIISIESTFLGHPVYPIIQLAEVIIYYNYWPESKVITVFLEDYIAACQECMTMNLSNVALARHL